MAVHRADHATVRHQDRRLSSQAVTMSVSVDAVEREAARAVRRLPGIVGIRPRGSAPCLRRRPPATSAWFCHGTAEMTLTNAASNDVKSGQLD